MADEAANRTVGFICFHSSPKMLGGRPQKQPMPWECTNFVEQLQQLNFKVPRWSALRKDHFVASFRFLVFRFRLDSWWFGVPLLVRGPLINLPVVLATDYPPIQVVIIAMILTTVMVPWQVGSGLVADSVQTLKLSPEIMYPDVIDGFTVESLIILAGWGRHHVWIHMDTFNGWNSHC